MSSEARFGYEWNKYSALDPNYEKQFINWIFPLGADFFKGKKVLDAGCGMGRNSYWPLKWGVGEVTAFDYDQRSVAAAKKNLADFKNARVLFKSIYEISWQNEFDVAMSIGVIHHLAEPELALKKLVRALKPGGTLIVWVYSYEGNEWIKKYVSPIRKSLTSKLSVGLVHWLSYFFSLPLWLFVKIFKGPGDYFQQLSTFKFWHVQSIVFDQLIPEVANYWTKDEVRNLFKELELTDIKINRPPNNCGWTVIAKK
ncbi:MAG: class I SAM-dependent methyltransferase [Patescibacteria group bacterium]|nr:class I SAM-dependent methyltransferase [Patescibacteria group bacterium]